MARKALWYDFLLLLVLVVALYALWPHRATQLFFITILALALLAQAWLLGYDVVMYRYQREARTIGALHDAQVIMAEADRAARQEES